MWLFTEIGMFSAVEVSKDSVVVRSRALDDLLNLREKFSIPGKPVHLKGRDYQWRIHVSKDRFAQIVFDLASDIDYGNFKERIGHDDRSRAIAYGSVWSAMRDFGDIKFDEDQFYEIR